MVNKVLTANGEAVSSDTIYDLEDVINAAHSAALAADAIIDGSVGSVMSDDEVNVAVYAVKHARDAVRTAHSAFHVLADGMRFAKGAPAPAPSQDALNAATGMAELLYLAAKSLQDEHERAGMTEGVFQLLTMLKGAGR